MSSEHLTETSGAMGVRSTGLAERLILPIFAATIFLGAFLLFSVQPMVAKMILPLLGGSPSVWNTAMVFFQAALLAGYAYAHLSVRWLGLRRQSLLHLGVLALAFLAWPVGLPEGWTPPRAATAMQRTPTSSIAPATSARSWPCCPIPSWSSRCSGCSTRAGPGPGVTSGSSL